MMMKPKPEPPVRERSTMHHVDDGESLLDLVVQFQKKGVLLSDVIFEATYVYASIEDSAEDFAERQREYEEELRQWKIWFTENKAALLADQRQVIVAALVRAGKHIEDVRARREAQVKAEQELLEKMEKEE